MARYLIPAFEVEAIEGFYGHNSEMQRARLANGWDLQLPITVRPERLPERLPALRDGYYTLDGYKGILKRVMDCQDGKAIWTEWSGDSWGGSGEVCYATEDSPSIRARFTYLGGI